MPTLIRALRTDRGIPRAGVYPRLARDVHDCAVLILDVIEQPNDVAAPNRGHRSPAEYREHQPLQIVQLPLRATQPAIRLAGEAVGGDAFEGRVCRGLFAGRLLDPGVDA